ncbi:MAG: M14 family zinc carboxypeptidase [Wenzhouxiangellaceae bacterium]
MLAAICGSYVYAQVEFRYTEEANGGNQFVLGYPPPEPVDSAVPLDGFRAYSSLHARHQDLMLQSERVTGEIIGSTILGREIWAYAIGDEDSQTINAGPESSALINGGIHAREWGTPELTTGLIEAAVENAGDSYLYDFLNDNVHFVVVPVNNVDGFVQTQRYPTRVLVGADPNAPQSSPRDGRMRRKNMRDVDEQLATLGDHLLGIDLNRNNEPFWALSASSSSNRDSLVYHGTNSFSEPETRALMAAAELAGEQRLRWYEDVHSFTQVLFSVRTFKPRRNAIQSQLLSSFTRFHDALSIERHDVSRVYPEGPNSIGSGIGVTAEYFGYEYEIPSWTLEIEPRQSAAEYGGLGAEHDGFILPDSEVARLREDMALTHALLAYRQAGPPSVAALELIDSRGTVVHAARWHYAGDGLRELALIENEPLLPGFEYTLRVSFDKPMRWADDGVPRQAPGHQVPLEPAIVLRTESGGSHAVDTAAGNWLGAPDEPFVHYRFDTFETKFIAPLDPVMFESGQLTMEIDAEDFTEQRLDADPATVVDWQQGAWRGYENSSGQPRDSGGTDSTLTVRIAEPWEARLWLLRRGR